MKLSPKAQKSIDKVIDKFKTGDLSPIIQVARINLDPDAPAAKWSFSNKVLAFAQTGDLDCRGYRQWQAFGRQVKRGSVAGFIFSPRTVKKTKKNGDGEDEEYRACIGFIPIAVFPSSGTEGDTPLQDHKPAELPPLADVARRLGIELTWQPLPPDRLGDCLTDGSAIRLATDDEAVFFHELAHAAHAELNGESGLKNGSKTQKETVAEFTSAVLMELYGIRDNSGNAWNYISMYAKDPITAISKAMGTVEGVLDLLLDKDV